MDSNLPIILNDSGKIEEQRGCRLAEGRALPRLLFGRSWHDE